MSKEMVQQRIKYLIEHGELYPPPTEATCSKRLWWAITTLVVLNIWQSVQVFLLP